MNNIRAQIGRCPRSQCRCRKNKQRSDSNHDSAKHDRLNRTPGNGGCYQMSEPGDKTCFVKNRKPKPKKINRANDPESPFEFKFCSSHLEAFRKAQTD